MRKSTPTNESETAAVVHDQDCVWCRGKNFISVPNYLSIDETGIDRYLERGFVVAIPKMGIACPVCHPNGITIGKRTVLSLPAHADKIRECYPYEYFCLLCTTVYLDLRMNEGSELAMREMMRHIDGAGNQHLIETYLNASTTRRPFNPPKFMRKNKYLSNAVEVEEKRRRNREALDRMIGERGNGNEEDNYTGDQDV